MRKSYLLVLIVIALITVFSVIYYSLLLTPFSNNNEPQNQENGTPVPYVLPFRLPWEVPVTTNKSSGGGTGGSGSGGSGGSDGSEGSVGSGETEVPRVYYQINTDTIPEGLEILASYYLNDSFYYQTLEAPFNLEADAGTPVCLLPASIINGTLGWTVDGQECQYSVCELSSRNRTEGVYSDHGCLVTMDTNHSIILQYTPNQ